MIYRWLLWSLGRRRSEGRRWATKRCRRRRLRLQPIEDDVHYRQSMSSRETAEFGCIHFPTTGFLSQSIICHIAWSISKVAISMNLVNHFSSYSFLPYDMERDLSRQNVAAITYKDLRGKGSGAMLSPVLLCYYLSCTLHFLDSYQEYLADFCRNQSKQFSRTLSLNLDRRNPCLKA